MSLGSIKDALLSIPGFHTNRKIVVFESDDWGSIRMPSRKVFDLLVASGIDLTAGDSKRYNLYDTLASTEDLELLFDVLKKYKDKNGRNPIFTALCLVANPDFEKIRADKFERYHYEPVTETLARYYPAQRVFDKWQEGVKMNVFRPQFHGREHLNVNAWMKALLRKDREAHLAFDNGIWGINNKHRFGVSFQAAFDLDELSDLETHRDIIDDGLALFEKLFGYKAAFFVPPNGILHEEMYQVSRKKGIDYVYSSKLHPVPVGNGNYKKRFNFLGKKNSAGQLFVTRNAFFEPSQSDGCVFSCLKEIETSFRWNKPAIISSHRVNYIGAIDPSNRENGLRKLDELLTEIVSRWPDVEFMSTEQVGLLMKTQ